MVKTKEKKGGQGRIQEGGGKSVEKKENPCDSIVNSISPDLCPRRTDTTVIGEAKAVEAESAMSDAEEETWSSEQEKDLSKKKGERRKSQGRGGGRHCRLSCVSRVWSGTECPSLSPAQVGGRDQKAKRSGAWVTNIVAEKEKVGVGGSLTSPSLSSMVSFGATENFLRVAAV